MSAPNTSHDNFVIRPQKGANHLLHFSNKTGSFWVGESNKETRHFLMGLISHRETIFADYNLYLNNKKLERDKIQEVSYYPWLLKRTYSGQVSEELFMPDSLDAMAIRFAKPLSVKDVSFTLYGNGFKEIIEVDSIGKNQTVTIKTDKSLNSFVSVHVNDEIASALLINGDLLIRFKKSTKKGSGSSKSLFAIGLASDSIASKQIAIDLSENIDKYIASKKKRISELIDYVSFKSNDENVNQALKWALVSFDNLNMNETRTGLGKGIYAGYPWFQDYWGRDSFIALRALTVTGQFDLAKENLLSFLRYQVQDEGNENYGKIPNRVRPDESIYNTADATPRFIIEAWNYYAYSGDIGFLNEVLPYINHAVLGTLKYRTNKDGFIVHGGADTWMDAVGPKGPYSPRGDKANDIQVLWVMALDGAAKMAELNDNYKDLAKLASGNRDRVNNEFKKTFLSRNVYRSIVYDAIFENGDHSDQIRVNQIFTLPIVSEYKIKAQIIEQVTKKLGTPYGPLSLSTDDPWFHPYHKMEPFYEQDAAYHNGIIWVWNTGDYVGSLLRYANIDMGFEIIQNYSDRILSDISLGTLPELYDAFPRHSGWSKSYPNKDEFKNISRFDQMTLMGESGLNVGSNPPGSGTFSQAWSLSEYIRMLVEHLPGIRYEQDLWNIRPVLPKGLETYSLKTHILQAEIMIDVSNSDNILKIDNKGEEFELQVAVPRTDDAMKFTVPKGKSTILVNEFNQRGFTEDKKIVFLYRKANVYKEEALVKKAIGDLEWPDFSQFEGETFPYKTQMK